MIQVIISGNLTADAIEKTVNGNTLVSFTIANNSRFKTANGTQKEETEFINCALWNKPAILPHLTKGRSITAHGILKVRRWQDLNGTDRTSVNCRVSFIDLFGKGKQRKTSAKPNEEVHELAAAIEAHEQEETIKNLPF